MRIGFDARILTIPHRAQLTGSETYAYNILGALLRSGADVVIFQASGSEPLYPDFQVPRRFARSASLVPIWGALAVGLAARQAAIDVLLIPDHYAPVVRTCKVIAVLYDLSFVRFPSSYSLGLRMKLTLGTRLAESLSDHIVTISQRSEADLRALHGVSSDRITIAYPGYDRQLFRPRKLDESRQVLERLGINRPYLLFVGSILPQKNVLALVRAITRVPGHDLVLAGRDRGYGRILMAEANRLDVGNRIKLLGYVDDMTKTHLMAQASVFLFPSRHEGFGIPVLEAMACGTPVVVSTDPALVELVESAGIAVDPSDLNELVTGIRNALSQEVRVRLRRAGLARASDFDWDVSARKILDVARTLIAPSSSGGERALSRHSN